MWCLLFSTVFTGNKKIWAILIHIKKFGSQTQYSQLYIICQFIFVHYAQLHLQIIFQNNLETINFTLMFLFRLLQHIYSTSKVNPMLKYATCQCLSKSFYKMLFKPDKPLLFVWVASLSHSLACNHMHCSMILFFGF